MIWDRLTSPEIGTLDPSRPVVLPMAATEQHGPHLPLATDRMIAEHLAAALDVAMSGKVLILPVLSVGCSRHHMDFPGTLSLSHDTFRALALDVLESARAHGFSNFLLFNSHGGNQAISGVVAEHFGGDHPECRVVHTSWWQVARKSLMRLSSTGPGGVGHACEFETSLMLHINPELVRTDLIPARANIPAPEWAEGDMLRGARAPYYRSTSQMTLTGVFGEPKAATAALGKSITQAVVGALLPVLMDLAEKPKNEDPPARL